jgi:Co/Zn/Cd efflux system component
LLGGVEKRHASDDGFGDSLHSVAISHPQPDAHHHHHTHSSHNEHHHDHDDDDDDDSHFDHKHKHSSNDHSIQVVVKDKVMTRSRHSAVQEDVNIYAMLIHVVGDVLSSIVVLIVGVLYRVFGHSRWVVYVDPIASLVIVFVSCERE